MTHRPWKKNFFSRQMWCFFKVRILGYEQISQRHQAIGFLTRYPQNQFHMEKTNINHNISQRKSSKKIIDVSLTQQKKQRQTHMFFYWTDFLLVPDACFTLADVFGIHGFLVQVWGSAARNDDDKVPPNKISLAKSRNDTFYRSDIYILL